MLLAAAMAVIALTTYGQDVSGLASGHRNLLESILVRRAMSTFFDRGHPSASDFWKDQASELGSCICGFVALRHPGDHYEGLLSLKTPLHRALHAVWQSSSETAFYEVVDGVMLDEPYVTSSKAGATGFSRGRPWCPTSQRHDNYIGVRSSPCHVNERFLPAS